MFWPETEIKVEEEMLRSLPEQINFISMNPRTHCFLLAHLNRQEANFKWSGPHSTAVYVRERGRETQRDRERGEGGREISTYEVLKVAGKEKMQQMKSREEYMKSVRDLRALLTGGGGQRGRGEQLKLM